MWTSRLYIDFQLNFGKLDLPQTMLAQTYDNNKLVFRFSSTPTDFNIVVVQEQLTACSVRKSCSFRTANFWLTYLQQHEKKSNSQPTLKRFIKICYFSWTFSCWIVAGKRVGVATRVTSCVQDFGRACKGLRHEIRLMNFFSSVKNRISRKSKGYPTCTLLNSPRVKSSLALYNLSKRIERPLLISPNDWNKLHSQGIRNLQRGIENPRLS